MQVFFRACMVRIESSEHGRHWAFTIHILFIGDDAQDPVDRKHRREHWLSEHDAG